MNKLYPILIIGLFISHFSFSQQQTGTIKGNITTSGGELATFVNVRIKGENKGTVTNGEGQFQLKHIKQGSYTLEVSFIGFQVQEKEVEVIAGQVTSVEIVLQESSEHLKEVVISDSRTLNEKTVEIGKAGIKLMDLPQSVLVIDRTVLENQQVSRLSDVLVNTSGIYLMGTTGGVQEEIAGRGFSYGSTNTFKNGVRFNNGVMPEVSSLERVEVLKGSAAILFGNVTAGGVLNLVTKKPKFENGGEISFRAGSYDFYKPSLDIYGSVNESKTVAYRLNTTYENAASFRDNVNSERIYFNPSFLIQAGKKTEILIEGDFLKDSRTLDYGTGAVKYKIADVPRNRFLGASWSYYSAKQKSLTATITHNLGNDWKISTVIAHQDYLANQFGTSRPNNGSTAFMVKDDGTWVRTLQRSQSNEDYNLAQVDLTGKFKTGSIRHNVLVGVDHDQYETITPAFKIFTNGTSSSTVYDTANIYDPSAYEQRSDIPEASVTILTTVNVTRVGVYVQDLVEVTDKIKLLAGVRYSYLETRSVIDTLAKIGIDRGVPRFDEAFTPRVGLVYQPLKSISVFASYASSFNPNTVKDVNNKLLPPSIVDQLEIGIKNELFKGLLSANLTAYQIVNSNLAQSVIPIPAGADNQNNPQELAGEVTSKGIEVDIMSKQIRGATFITGYSYNDTRYTKSSQFIDGSRLRYNPSHTANASVYYKFANSILKNFNVGFTTFYIGERVAGRSTRTNVPNDAFKLMPVPNYFLFDLTAGYSIQNISLRMKVSNLLNELSYNAHDDNSVNPIAPRQFSATVTYKLR